MFAMKFVRGKPEFRHCEERSDEAIQSLVAGLDCFASLAMTRLVAWIERAKSGNDRRVFAPILGFTSFNPGYKNRRSDFEVNLFNSIGERRQACRARNLPPTGCGFARNP
jgi:hypothetical protein